ncbi:MAG: DNRLRE domain-containing protein [Deltaproteobacteria bacterium]|nr:DNRLRE domain-containing protein [Deltaproteobacteria bacterium]
MQLRKVYTVKRTLLLTLVLSLSFIFAWEVTAHAATTVTFGDNTDDDFSVTVEDAGFPEEVSQRDNNYGAGSYMYVGTSGTSGRRSLIRFKDINSHLPAGIVITSATMYLYCSAENSPKDYSISAHRVLLNWGEGNSNGTPEVGALCANDAQYNDIIDWNSLGCNSASDTVGEDDTADRRATAEATRLITGTGWFTWDLTTAVQNWYSGSWSEYGVVLISDGASDNDSAKTFFSSENPNDGGRPYLEVTYDTAVPGSACSYSDSAHGDPSNGVQRMGTAYAIGHCSNCHDTSDSSTCGVNQRMFFAPNNPDSQTDNFCFQCHKAASSVQYGGITNYDYSETFGGAEADVADGPEGVYEAFNNGVSYHNLSDVLNFVKDHWGATFADSSNACSGCHNVHIARRNKANKNDPGYTAISMPSAHNQLHGDDVGERMSDYSSYYVNPHWYASYRHEPAYNYTEDGSNLPNFVDFCLDCHTKAIASTSQGRNLKAPDWATLGGEIGGDKHGKNTATSFPGFEYPPYDSVWTPTNGVVLSCTDCHESHGSITNVMLLRREINGHNVPPIESLYTDPFDPTDFGSVCVPCHPLPVGGWWTVHHDSPNAPYPDPHISDYSCTNCHPPGAIKPIDCPNCHFHGGDDRWVDDRTPGYETGRRTF